MKTPISKTTYFLFAAVGFICLLSLWSLITYQEWVSPIFLPSPSKVLNAFWTLLKANVLPYDVCVSFARIILGIVLSFCIAFPLGIFMGLSKKIEALIEPLLSFIRYVPASCFIPLAIIWFGIGELEKLIVLLLGLTPYVAILIAGFVIKTNKVFLDAARTLGASEKQLVFRIIIPSIFPYVWDTLRICFGTAWTLIIIAEIVGASSGLGQLIANAGRFLQTAQVFAAIFVIGTLGFLTDYFFKWTYGRFFPWMNS